MIIKKAVLFLFFILFISTDAWALKIHGFAENASGAKLGNDTTKHDSYNILEQRLQIKTSYRPSGDSFLADWRSEFNFKGDFLIDEYFGGKTSFDLRECNALFTPLDMADIKIGRQVLTWGTGDYLFINDMFPKDYVSFYIGRDDEYLKKPSDAVRISLYPRMANIDIAVIPFFTPNTVPDGERLSFFDSFNRGIRGREVNRLLLEPADQSENTEFAVRTYKHFGSYEYALYFFRGFDKSPRSYKNEALRHLYYKRLDVYGASVRGPFSGGIGNIEIGYYNSRDDSNGDNRLIENSFFKALAGYEKDLGNDLKAGFQYFYEQRLDYKDYANALVSGDFFWDEHRHLVTNRITKLFKNQTVTVSLFTFYSPSDKDVYLRPSVSYDINDDWKIAAGANLAWGEDDITEFGQMENNKNIYFRIRYGF
jgi:hypothetical protein